MKTLYAFVATAMIFSLQLTPAFAQQRQQTGEGGTLAFSAGDDVMGYKITFSDGTSVYECVVQHTQLGGQVTSGVVGGIFAGELNSNRPCFGSDGTVATTPKNGAAVTASGETINGRERQAFSGDFRFEAGDAVVAGWIVLDDKREMGNCKISNAPVAGTGKSGVKNPWNDEVKDKNEC